jgi:signal transduction histidine kinase/DNA-binding response OmpR family regulator
VKIIQSNNWLTAAFNKVRKALKIRIDLPSELETQFTEFKDIQSIDRIHVAAWIGFAMSIFLFPLDYHRYVTGEFVANQNYRILFYFHVFGLVFIIPALSIALRKEWVKATRLRRGIHIWGMVVLTFIYLFGMAIVVFLDRDGLIMYMAFVFISGWMFAMSHKERLMFNIVTLTTMFLIIYFKEQVSYPKVAMYYEIIFLSLIAFFFDAFDYNLKVENFLALRSLKNEQDKIQKLEEFKSRFFTNLTHDLRTPLTLISGMAKEISENPKRWAIEGSEIINLNSKILINIINQILDLSKMESNSMPIQLIKGDIVAYLGFITDAFRGQTYARNIQLHFLSDEVEIIMDYDPQKYLTILSNLLSNAVKFTAVGGNIYVQLSKKKSGNEDFLEIVVRDTGSGIPPESLPHIFERYYQVESNGNGKGIGTGIGLSVVRELVKLLNGTIDVKSNPEKGTHFSLHFPVTTYADALPIEVNRDRITQDIKDSYVHLSPEALEEFTKTFGESPEVLIIEDNPDVIKYLKVCLGDIFQLSFSRNGDDGMAKAIETVPDLVISDVMMPGKDGYALTRELKQHQGTSHIPVVLLSGLSDVDSRVRGLESGADLYLIKPFEKRELRTQLRNLLTQRREQQMRYADGGRKDVAEDIKAPEDEFVLRVRKIIQDHLDDADFSVNELSRAVFLSRTQLHKKLKALTGQSAQPYIMDQRLNAALDLLKDPSLSIGEIAFRVGFDDPNYFSRCFAIKYGMTPSETRK